MLGLGLVEVGSGFPKGPRAPTVRIVGAKHHADSFETENFIIWGLDPRSFTFPRMCLQLI